MGNGDHSVLWEIFTTALGIVATALMALTALAWKSKVSIPDLDKRLQDMLTTWNIADEAHDKALFATLAERVDGQARMVAEQLTAQEKLNTLRYDTILREIRELKAMRGRA